MVLRIAVVVMVFAVGFTARLTYEAITHPTTLAYAQEQDLSCSDFHTQAEAQAELDRDLTDPHNLDPNITGVACEDFDYADDSAAQEQYDDGTVRLPEGDNGRTPRTGGLVTDTFPLMDDGTCPTPLVKRNGACYP